MCNQILKFPCYNQTIGACFELMSYLFFLFLLHAKPSLTLELNLILANEYVEHLVISLMTGILLVSAFRLQAFKKMSSENRQFV